MKRLNQINQSDLFCENLVDKSLGSATLKLSYSDRQRLTRENKKEKDSGKNCSSSFLGSLPELLRPESAASIIGVSIKTIYDWHYRCKQRKIPAELFVKVNRSLLIRTSVLREWIASQNPSLERERKLR